MGILRPRRRPAPTPQAASPPSAQAPTAAAVATASPPAAVATPAPAAATPRRLARTVSGNASSACGTRRADRRWATGLCRSARYRVVRRRNGRTAKQRVRAWKPDDFRKARARRTAIACRDCGPRPALPAAKRQRICSSSFCRHKPAMLRHPSRCRQAMPRMAALEREQPRKRPSRFPRNGRTVLRWTRIICSGKASRPI